MGAGWGGGWGRREEDVFIGGVNRRRGGVSVPIEGETFRDGVDAWKKDVAPCTVATICEPSKIVCWEHAELPDISVRLDFGLAQGIFVTADAIDCSRAVMSILQWSELLFRGAIRSAGPIVISRGLFPAFPVTP